MSKKEKKPRCSYCPRKNLVNHYDTLTFQNEEGTKCRAHLCVHCRDKVDPLSFEQFCNECGKPARHPDYLLYCVSELSGNRNIMFSCSRDCYLITFKKAKASEHIGDLRKECDGCDL